MTELPVAVVSRAHRALDPLHSMIYFAPEAEEELVAVGLRPGRMCYFASRSAAMGPVSPGVTAATFYNFNPTLVARHLPRAWTLADPGTILAARLRAADRALRRLLGDAAGSSEVTEAADLARDATATLRPHGRPLYAAHADLDWPTDPHLVLWHAITLLREHRGDGHIAALLDSGMSGLDALITHTATGRGFTDTAARATRGWSDEEWTVGVTSLHERGLLDGDGGLTAAGRATRDAVELATDRMATDPWNALGAERTARLTELGKGLTRLVVGNGAFPDGVFASSR